MTTATEVKVNVRPEVQRGAELLDEHVPGWDKQIDLTILHQNWCDKCVVGQLFSWYYEGLHNLGIEGESVEYGFDLPDTEAGKDELWAELTEEWRDLIASRR